jgi:hypothetical protein
LRTIDTSVVFLPVSEDLAVSEGMAVPGSLDRPSRRRRSRLRAPLAVAWARLRARPGRALLVVAGVAAATAALAGVVGGSLLAQDRTLQRALAALPDSGRSFRVDSFGLPSGSGYAAADRKVRAALARLSPVAPYRLTSFRTLTIDGELVRLAGIDDLPHIARLVSGRWPRTCTPARCEVVQVGTGGSAKLSEGGINLVRVGHADVPGRSAFGGSLATSSPFAQVRHPVLLLGNGAAEFERLPAFSDIFRTYTWISPVDPSRIQIWDVGNVLARESAVQALLAQESENYQLTGPDAALIEARTEGHVAARRMVLVGGEISALLLGFALVAAIGLRRGVWNEARRLAQRGARRSQVWLAVATEVGAMALTGAVAGLLLGVLAVLLVSGSAGVPSGALLRHSIVSWVGLAIVAAVWAVATIAIVVAVATPERRRRGPGIRVVDVAAAGAAIAVVVGLSSGQANAGTLTGNRLLYILLPGLICFVAAVVAGRLLAPAMRVGERATRGAATAIHLAFLALARAPARTIATVGFLLVAIGLALFAVSYRATLSDGARDEAAYAVPLDFSLTEGSQLVLPLHAASIKGYESLAPGVSAYPVLRRTANIPGSGASVLSPTVIGLPPQAIAKLHWRSDYSSLSPKEIAARVAAGGPASLRGVPIPPGARELSTTVRVRGIPVEYELVAENATGGIVKLPLGERGPGRWTLKTEVPPGGKLTQVVGLTVAIGPLTQQQIAHDNAEGETAVVPSGSTALGPLVSLGARGGTSTMTDWSGWLARGGATLDSATPPVLGYSFTSGQTMVVRMPQATDGRPIAAIVSSGIAKTAPSGQITLNFQSTELPAQIVGVAKRFPDSGDQGQGFVIVDESRLATALSADAPGTAVPDELWLSVPSASSAARVETALGRSPFSALQVASRRDLQHQLASQPLARGITLTLGAAALIAVLLAAVGFLLTLVSDARDERGELFDLEAQGVPPGTLRNQLRARSLVLVAFGAVAGLALGLVLSRLVVSVAGVSAETTDPVPPLRYQPALEIALPALLVLVLVLAALVELTARHALRGDTPARASWSLE